MATVSSRDLVAPARKVEAIQHDPLAIARAKGTQIKAKILVESVSSQTIIRILKISRPVLDKYRKQGLILALPQGHRSYIYPLWQIHKGKILPGLPQVLAELSGISDWGKAIFLTTGDLRLNNATPIDCLRQGKVKEVIAAAQLYGHHSAT